MNSSEKHFWTSKKFWAMFAGIASLSLTYFFGVPQEITLGIAGIVMTYIFGQSAIDLWTYKNSNAVITESKNTNELINNLIKEYMPIIIKLINGGNNQDITLTPVPNTSKPEEIAKFIQNMLDEYVGNSIYEDTKQDLNKQNEVTDAEKK